MKKKVLGVSLLAISVVSLVACSTKDDLSGEYYWISEGRNDFMLTISNNGTGTMDIDGYDYPITEVNQDKKQLVVNVNDRNYVVPYKYESGILTLKRASMRSSSGVSYYKKYSKACAKALKKNGFSEVGKYK